MTDDKKRSSVQLKVHAFTDRRGAQRNKELVVQASDGAEKVSDL
jgi:hypothetical protein